MIERRQLRNHALSLAVVALVALTASTGAQQFRRLPQTFDLVVYGGTAGGVMTGVAAAREGLTVALVEPGRHLGGMVSGGLGWTDYGKKEVIGGFLVQVFPPGGREEWPR